MGFLAPSLLPLAALAAIPIAIHILSRLRLKRADFPSLLLLTTARRERFSWLRLKELLLLIFRTLALLGLLLALGERPDCRARRFVQHVRAAAVAESYRVGTRTHWIPWTRKKSDAGYDE